MEAASTFHADVSDRDQVAAAFDEAIGLYGKIDIVINAGATSTFAPLEAITTDDLEKAIAINVRGAFNVLQEAAVRTADGGRIVQFSTGGTKMPVAGGSVYSGTKSAGENFALGLSKELGSRQITVNVISPGVTDTDGLVMPEEQVKMLIGQTPLGRLGQPEDIADVVMFLVSHEGRWINGQNIQANGGIL
ncbi:SDR family oxidoreductase [uncultured Erythrobacter sp.]|uniref:SDR family oxidoreductase n=1 Tax=uncultured Erythrobacter sp. TaxID=263913 RepID=UPI0026293B4A|nr:SDR family oxidoreductase [uncultured Erythrobacter sp.]